MQGRTCDWIFLSGKDHLSSGSSCSEGFLAPPAETVWGVGNNTTGCEVERPVKGPLIVGENPPPGQEVSQSLKRGILGLEQWRLLGTQKSLCDRGECTHSIVSFDGHRLHLVQQLQHPKPLCFVELLYALGSFPYFIEKSCSG